MSISNKLFSELKQNSLLLTSLHGVRAVLERELELNNVMIASDETIKAELARKNITGFPYSYLNITEVIGVTDQSNNLNMRRNGIPAGNMGSTRATVRKGYLFPINVGMDFKYVNSDPYDVLAMAEAFAILSLIEGLSFKLQLSDALDVDVKVEVPPNVAIPIASINDPQSPGGIELAVSLIVHTYAGFFRDVSGVNSNRAVVQTQLSVNVANHRG